jgi:putative phage-type endonuclease
MAIYEQKESYAASRSGGIGGTDASAILGLSPWKRPIDIYAGKVNPQDQPELDKECLYWGSAMEPLVRGRYAERFGVAVTAPADLAAIFPKSRPWRDSTLIEGRESWMLGAPDGWIPSVHCGLEIKCASRKSDDWGPEGSDEVPAHYLVQASWYAAVCDAKGWNFGVLFSGNTLAQYHINRDLDLERDMIEACRSFWFDNVLKRVEPAIDESESYGRYLARKFSLNTGKALQPTPDILHWTSEMKSADDAEKEAAEQKQLANNHLRALIGDAQKCVTLLGTVGWVRPEEKDVTDYAAVGEEVGPLHPEIVKKHTKPKQGTAYLRAWWKK